jgi:hypothetical protein
MVNPQNAPGNLVLVVKGMRFDWPLRFPGSGLVVRPKVNCGCVSETRVVQHPSPLVDHEKRQARSSAKARGLHFLVIALNANMIVSRLPQTHGALLTCLRGRS